MAEQADAADSKVYQRISEQHENSHSAENMPSGETDVGHRKPFPSAPGQSRGNESEGLTEKSRFENAPGFFDTKGSPTPKKVGTDPVEAALADALTRASVAGEWTVVAQLAAELQARREARAKVVQLDSERARRGKQ
ncbi:MAG TPA: hypothetical protein VGJ84_12275 [Polyangiaceae bacterium]